jgi:tetratricopeptide (TPR) repeat protein
MPPSQELEIRYDQAAITPFWQKLPFIFLFPFRFGPLVFMACIVAASAIAGLALGAFSIVFKGILVYLGLRYGFNVLELFARGRFEGESVDHRLWGPEKRPAKLGLVIALFIVLVVNIGNLLVASRIAGDPRTQDILVARYQKAHAEEIAERERDRQAFYKRYGLDSGGNALPSTAAPAATPRADTAAAEGDEEETPPSPPGAVAAAEPPPVYRDIGPSRQDMIESWRPDFTDPLWYRLLPAWYWLVVAALSLVLPAAAVVIALEDNFFRALNPLNVTHLIGAMGSAYFVLWAFFLAIAGTRHLVLTAGANLPAVLRFPLEMGVATYLGLVLFALMGYALYQFHQELHLDVDVDFDDHRAAGGAEAIAAAGSARKAIHQTQGPQDPVEAKVQAALARGDVKDAIAEVKDAMRYDRFDARLNTRLHQLYVQQGERETILAHGQQWLSALARAGQGKELLAALQELQQLDAAFMVQDGDAVLPAAQAAMQQRDFALATALLRGFDKRFPKHKDTPSVFFLGARLLSEQSRQHEKAVVLLRAVLKHFPDHAIAAEVQTYLKVLEAMLAKAHGAP